MRVTTWVLISLILASPLLAQTTQPVTTEDPTTAIGALRAELVDSFNSRDLPRLLSHMDPDVVITWQNGEVSRGPDEVRKYYDKMMTGPDRRVETIQADPKVTDRHVYEDYAVSWGTMNDEFVLTDGTRLKLDSRFTATIARRGAAWKVTSFHVSANVFDNPIMNYALKRTATITAIVAGLVGVVLGFFITKLVRRKST